MATVLTVALASACSSLNIFYSDRSLRRIRFGVPIHRV
jgi:hypothetical protein